MRPLLTVLALLTMGLMLGGCFAQQQGYAGYGGGTFIGAEAASYSCRTIAREAARRGIPLSQVRRYAPRCGFGRVGVRRGVERRPPRARW